MPEETGDLISWFSVKSILTTCPPGHLCEWANTAIYFRLRSTVIVTWPQVRLEPMTSLTWSWGAGVWCQKSRPASWDTLGAMTSLLHGWSDRQPWGHSPGYVSAFTQPYHVSIVYLLKFTEHRARSRLPLTFVSNLLNSHKVYQWLLGYKGLHIGFPNIQDMLID